MKFLEDYGIALDEDGLYDEFIYILDAYVQAYNESKGE